MGMTTIFLVSHGGIAAALVDGAQMIAGEQQNIRTFGLLPGESPDNLREQLREALEEERENEVLLFTDIRSGTPFNAAVSLMEEYGFRHISGVNLALLLEALMGREEMGLGELCDSLMQMSPMTILDVNSLLGQVET